MKKKEYINELRELTQEGLEERIGELAEEKMKTRFRKGSTEMTEKHLVRAVKQKLAQAKTVYFQKFEQFEA